MEPVAKGQKPVWLKAGTISSRVRADSKPPAPKAIIIATTFLEGRNMIPNTAPIGNETALMIPSQNARAGSEV